VTLKTNPQNPRNPQSPPLPPFWMADDVPPVPIQVAENTEIAARPHAQTARAVEMDIERRLALKLDEQVSPKPETDEPIQAMVARARALPLASPARNRLSPEQEATQRAIDNPTLWLAEWQAVLKREKLPVSWPAAAGVPPDIGVCGCCGARCWWLNENTVHGDGHWVCNVCHPPPPSRAIRLRSGLSGRGA